MDLMDLMDLMDAMDAMDAMDGADMVAPGQQRERWTTTGHRARLGKTEESDGSVGSDRSVRLAWRIRLAQAP